MRKTFTQETCLSDRRVYQRDVFERHREACLSERRVFQRGMFIRGAFIRAFLAVRQKTFVYSGADKRCS